MPQELNKNTFAASDDVYPPQHTNPLQVIQQSQLQAVQQAVLHEREPASNPAQAEAKPIERIQAKQKQNQREFGKASD